MLDTKCIDYKLGSEGKKPSTFWNNEPKVAAYLGYNNVAAFRKFRFSFPILEAYEFFAQYCSHGSSIAALDILGSENDLEKFHGGNLEAILQAFPPPEKSSKISKKLFNQQDRIAKDRLLACLLYKVVTYTEAELTITEDDKIQRQRAASLLFEAGKSKIPDFDIRDVELPCWGPIPELGEQNGEAYNRAYNLLRSLHYVMVPSRWKASFGSHVANPLRNKIVGQDCIPSWMLPQDEPPRLPSFITDRSTGHTATKLQKKDIKLLWLKERKTKFTKELEEHQEAYLETEGLSMPPEICDCNADPRIFELPEQWRDAVRAELDFRLKKLNFFTMKMEVAAPRKTLDIYGRGEVASWQDFQAAVNEAQSTISVRYTIRPVDELVVEYTGPPLALRPHLYLDEGMDVSSHNTAAQHVNELQEQLETSDPQMRLFLDGQWGNAPRKMPTPRGLFPKDDQRELMLEAYCGFDAWTATGLLSWQKYAIERCLSMERSMPDVFRNVTKAKLVGAKDDRLTKDQLKELSVLEGHAVQAALAVDVSSCFPKPTMGFPTSKFPYRRKHQLTRSILNI